MPSLSEFLAENDEIVTRVRGCVPLDLVGALTAQARTPILFDNLAEHPGWRLADQLFVTREAQARVLGSDPGDPTSVVRALVQVLRRGPRPLHHLPPGEAACQETVLTGDDIDLSLLPIVTHTARDPYPYTTSFAVHRNPDSGQGNQMFPRCGVLGRAEMVTSFVTSTANRFLARHRALGTKMPQAVVIGAHPGWELAGCYSAPHDDWCELELFESITGHRGDLASCVTVPLAVPADASVVIEGWVDPHRRATDGPSPGPNMLYTPHASQQPVFEVTAITMRRDPVYRNHLMTPQTDHQEMPRLFHEAILFERLRAMGIGVRDVHFPPAGGHFSCLLQVEPTMDGQVTDALLCALGAPWLNMKMVVAVDPDIDIYNEADVHYAIASRVDPARDVLIIPGARATPFDPTATPVLDAGADAAETRFPSTVGKWAIDATKPVPYRAAARALFDRAWPAHTDEVKLSDYLRD
ncbi:UbiD family decarboxylase [Amycolatopsis sp. NPDC005232]|uniref:UbiD family decarboxylase n=1 Tax=Amycolatopsis sp. NPDC005232 TaxID=3157027 RepID=UPI0033A896F0